MSTTDYRKQQSERRRVRLAEFIQNYFGGVQAKFVANIDANQGEISALLRTKSFGEGKARSIEEKAGMSRGALDDEPGSRFFPERFYHATQPNDAVKKRQTASDIATLSESERHSITGENKTRVDQNVAPAKIGLRQVPVISYVQAGMMTEALDPFALGDGFDIVVTDLDISSSAFALRIKGESMLPVFREGDTVIIDPSIAPAPGDMVVAKNCQEEATFKKFRPRGTSVHGELVFELVPLNDDFPTLHSERDQLHIIGVMVEHRQYRRR